MHGPQALANTLPPMDSKSLSKPSRSAVKRTCSEPGVTVYSLLTSNPFSAACLAIEAARVMSSYDELVHEPINPTSILVGQPLASAVARI